MKIIKRQFISLLLMTFTVASCGEYLDVVPDNIATIDNAFTSRSTAESFLFTCYSYVPGHADIDSQVFLAGDEYWVPYPQTTIFFYSPVFENMALGNQSVISPWLNYWDGLCSGKPMFMAMRDCNTFLEKINNVPGLDDYEKKRWIAEVKFLKAYFHYWLLRMYGPIPCIRTNLPVSASLDEIQVKREPVDSCFQYIVSLLNEAVPDLPLKIQDETTELGRITQPIALSVKAKVLCEAASPLFNGNSDYFDFTDKDGQPLFNPTYDASKWERAAIACRNAIDTCALAGNALYEYKPAVGETMSEDLIRQMSIRNSVAERWNSELIWGNPNSASDWLQRLTTPFLDPSKLTNMGVLSAMAPTMRVAESFYTSHGIPMNEDEEWQTSGKYAKRYNIRTATDADKLNIQPGYQTAGLNFDREPRFYANLSFDGNYWYGIGRFDENDQWVVMAKANQAAGKRQASRYSVTGYFCKKLANYQNVIQSGDNAKYTTVTYPWPVMRLADLYLLYSEALNEAYGPTEEAYKWIDLVRARAGLEPVRDAWNEYANPAYKNKPNTKEGLRSIIQQERLIELANEGHRYWEIRRWKRSREMYNNQPIRGWNVDESDAEAYYRIRTLYVGKFSTRDYLWPIREYNLSVNPRLVQNPGW